MNNTFGHNTRLSPDNVKRAVLERVQSLALRKGQQVPEDIMDFLDRADVIFLDENSQPVSFSRVVVTWEDR